MIIDATVENKELTKEVKEEKIFVDMIGVSNKKHKKIIERKHNVYKEKKAKQIVSMITRQRRMRKPSSILRF